MERKTFIDDLTAAPDEKDPELYERMRRTCNSLRSRHSRYRTSVYCERYATRQQAQYGHLRVCLERPWNRGEEGE
jgi:hypothetical protein